MNWKSTCAKAIGWLAASAGGLLSIGITYYASIMAYADAHLSVKEATTTLAEFFMSYRIAGVITLLLVGVVAFGFHDIGEGVVRGIKSHRTSRRSKQWRYAQRRIAPDIRRGRIPRSW
jgi:hypothetical protein